MQVESRDRGRVEEKLSVVSGQLSVALADRVLPHIATTDNGQRTTDNGQLFGFGARDLFQINNQKS
jgi:hypothetical protein